ncbi:MAG TPA: ATP-binding protein, partial [Alphaproteobacteria bacterium]
AAVSFTAVNVRAQDATSLTTSYPSEVVLNDRQTDYDITSFIYKTRDPTSELGTREIFLKHSNNLKGERLLPGPINFSFDPVPHWLVIDIRNNSRKSDWVFDFGSLDSGRLGLIPRMFINDGLRDVMLVDALPRSGAKDLGAGLNGHSVPISIQTGQRLTLVIYIVPSDHAPLILTPKIYEAAAFMDAQEPKNNILQYAVMIMLAGTAIFFAGNMFLRRGIGFFPHALFFALQGAWFWISTEEIFTNLPASLHLPGIALAAASLFALAITQSIIASQDSELGDSILLYICASFILLAIMVFIFAVPPGSILRPGIVYGAAGLGYLIAAFKALTVRAELKWSGIAAMFAWILMMAGAALPAAAGLGYLPLMPLYVQANWLVMPLVCILLMLSGVSQIRANNLGIIRDVLRQAQRAQALNRMKQTKESADQARLLRVIEREREIMEDLRNRDAERAEEMRMAKIAADEANRAKSAFLAVVSHEIRTPMTGIMGMIRLLQDSQMTNQQREYTQTIKDSGDAMLALLNDILDFSKIASGGMDLEIIDFDLHRVVNGVAMLMNGHADNKGLFLKVDIAEDTPRYLKGDPTRLRQVLLNLVGNAIKFTQKGGVTIHVHRNSDMTSPDRIGDIPVFFAVEDTGIGISAEAQKNLFNPFSQADSSIARKFGGTGLGLAICKKLIEAMGSSIELDSREGQGTTFHFTLMLPPGARDSIEDDSAQAKLLAKPMQVLVVDDNAINRKVIDGLLARDGHTTKLAGSGEEALDMLNQNYFDIVLMDIEMPDMDGLSVMKAIGSSGHEHIRDVPVVALTGNITSEDTASYRAAGMHDVLAKPIDPERLRDVLLSVGGPRSENAPNLSQAQSTPVAEPAVTYDLSPEELAEDSFSGSVEFEGTHAATSTMETPAQPASSPAPEDLFDTSILQTLRASLGQKQLDDMMAGVFEHNDKVLPQLQRSLNEGDTESLRAFAHELKGMNGNFGLKTISNICAAIENGARHKNISSDQMDELVFNDLPLAMNATKKVLKG